MRQQNNGFSEMIWTIRLHIPILPRSEILVASAVSNRGLHVEPSPIGEAVCYQLAYAIVPAAVAANIYDNRFGILELLHDFVYSRASLLHSPETAEVEVADRIGEPAIFEYSVHERPGFALEVPGLH